MGLEIILFYPLIIVIIIVLSGICFHKYEVDMIDYDQDQIYNYHIVECSKCGKKLKRKNKKAIEIYNEKHK